MIRNIVRGIITILFAGVGLTLTYLLLKAEFDLLTWTDAQNPYIYVVTGIVVAGLGFLLAPWIMNISIRSICHTENRLQKLPTNDLIGGAIGLIIGLIISALVGTVMVQVPYFGKFLAILITVFMSYLGIRLGYKRNDDLLAVFSALPRFGRERKLETKGTDYKILDTSVIIDGRIADILQTGFVEGTMLIPCFVLEELRHIADSADLTKRNRGRRGLDILNKISKEMNIRVEIYEKQINDVVEVDSKLVRLAQILDAQILTNDYNLNKVAELQGVKVLNINELANAVKPIVLPGEEMMVLVLKDGKEIGQGVAYLDDGTMIVIDGGKRYMGQTLNVMVTSVLQTAAGRMIFAKPKGTEKRGTGVQQFNEVNSIG